MRYYLSVLLFLLLVPVTYAANLNDWKIDISLNEDRTSEWIVTLMYDENVTKSDYFVISNWITGLEVTVNGKFIDCKMSKTGLGTSILCDNLLGDLIQYRFRAHGLIESTGNLELFRYRFSVSQRTDNFSVLVKLPLGSGLIEEHKLVGTGLKTFEPEWGKEGSDGRKIFLEWNIAAPKLGEVINVSIVYEQIIGFNYLLYVIFVIIIIAGFLLYIFFFRRRNITSILPVLTDGERKTMEILLREKKDVDQRQIIKETDFSKAKVSRIIQNLISRDLVEKIPKGRNNLIRLKKSKKQLK